MAEGRLAGKVAVITGAARGIGEAIARRFLAEGARVYLTDVKAELLQQTLTKLDPTGHRAAGGAADARSREDWEQVRDAVLARFGRVQILINNAGVCSPSPFFEVTDEQWNFTMDVNLRGTFLGCQIVGKAIWDEGGGAIVNAASTNGLRGDPELAAYNTSKAAIIGLTRCLAVELAPRVRVNVVAPGSVRTPIWEELGITNERLNYVLKAPLGRFAQPEELAALYAFLASDEASFITGQVYIADGGRTVIQ